jgi:hypothetical protein
MKQISPVALATWMLEHLPMGSHDESLSGDLLEEFQSGRSVGWYWRQAFTAIAVTLSSKARVYVLPLVFSAGWSILYPAVWLSVMRSQLAQSTWGLMVAHDWPYSTALQFVSVVSPAALFVWVGFFVYLTLRNRADGPLSMLRLLGSLSISLNVLFVVTIGQHMGSSVADLREVSWKDFPNHLVALCIPLALSLFSALVCVFSQKRERHRSADSLAR